MKLERVPLSHIAKIVQGGRHRLTGQHFVEPNEGYPAFGAGGLNGYLSTYEFDQPAVILSSIGARCGKCFLATGRWSSLANTQVILPDPSRADVRFLWYQLNDERSWIRSGTAQPFIKPANVKSRVVQLPPLAEQKRIAAILDAADTLRQKRREALAQLDTLAQSAFLEMFGDLIVNPHGYALCTLGDLLGDAHHFTDGDWVESKDQDPEGEVRLTQLADVGDGFWINKSQRYMTRAKAEELQCSFLKPGDVLVARMPDPLGRACLFPGDRMPCVTVVDVCIIRPNSNSVHPRYLTAALNSPMIRHDIHSRVNGTTRLRISRSNLSKVTLMAPPIAVQRRFAAIAESVEQQKAAQCAHLAELEALFASLQGRAFTCQL